MIIKDWVKFKTFITNYNAVVLEENISDYTLLLEAVDGPRVRQHYLEIDSDDYTDYITNIQQAQVASTDESRAATVQQIAPPPFAKPDYRTKRNGTAEKTTVAINTSGNIDYVLPEERYVYGGEIIIVNAQPGDYLTAEIHDPLSIIPEPYRVALCENWPTVAVYVEKAWVHAVNPSGTIVQKINTYPLNAKITPGLALRITYHTANSGVDRDVYVNYYLSKKIV